jgi:hypothetical protein
VCDLPLVIFQANQLQPPDTTLPYKLSESYFTKRSKITKWRLLTTRIERNSRALFIFAIKPAQWTDICATHQRYEVMKLTCVPGYGRYGMIGHTRGSEIAKSIRKHINNITSDESMERS